MSEFIPKWQKELDIFNKIKPIIIFMINNEVVSVGIHKKDFRF